MAVSASMAGKLQEISDSGRNGIHLDRSPTVVYILALGGLHLFQRMWALLRRPFVFFRKPARMLPLIAIAILAIAFWTSKHFISQPPILPSKWCRLLTPTAVFLLSSLITAFLGFLLVMVFTVILSLLRPGHISEFGAKILGIELSYKRDALAGERVLSETGAQLDSVTDLYEKTLEYLAGPFELPILKEADQADAIRSMIRDVLVMPTTNAQRYKSMLSR